ncbi:helix-turn-helix domain-containing protein [Mycobacterium riyadhense]|uniref:helix-turn-helix domain-containing protein n=1 Tax=Mycobacterium riyadhense TaxID=486698 RepID=UPI00194FE581|nr:helix-turn-helix domain-containing protein [Mycobacterium riyadhense]
MSRYVPPGQYKKPPGRLLSTTEAAAYLSISVRTLFKYRKVGKICAQQVGDKLWKYDRSDLDKFIQNSNREAING